MRRETLCFALLVLPHAAGTAQRQTPVRIGFFHSVAGPAESLRGPKPKPKALPMYREPLDGEGGCSAPQTN